MLLVLLVAALVILAELLWRSKLVRGEVGRKLVHIGAGSLIAFWPYFLNWQTIGGLGIAGVIVVLVARRMRFWHVGYDVKRAGWGELFFPLSVAITAALQPPALVFTAGFLTLAWADGLAALTGKYFTKKGRYLVYSRQKSITGTLTFLIISTVIIAGTVVTSETVFSWSFWPILIWLPVAATVVENAAVAGLDNLFVPLLVVVVLQLSGVH